MRLQVTRMIRDIEALTLLAGIALSQSAWGDVSGASSDRDVGRDRPLASNLCATARPIGCA